MCVCVCVCCVHITILGVSTLMCEIKLISFLCSVLLHNQITPTPPRKQCFNINSDHESSPSGVIQQEITKVKGQQGREREREREKDRERQRDRATE